MSHREDYERQHMAERVKLARTNTEKWLARGKPKPPPKPQFCASCILATPELVVRLSPYGRPVWVCLGCAF